MTNRNLLGTIALGIFAAACGETQQETRRAAPETAAAPSGPTVTSEQNDAIDAMFRRKTTELQSCWQDEYQRTKNRNLQGDISVQMIISRAGHAGDVKITKSTLGVDAIDQCVVKAISGWAFPEGPADAPYRRTVHLGAEF